MVSKDFTIKLEFEREGDYDICKFTIVPKGVYKCDLEIDYNMDAESFVADVLMKSKKEMPYKPLEKEDLTIGFRVFTSKRRRDVGRK